MKEEAKEGGDMPPATEKNGEGARRGDTTFVAPSAPKDASREEAAATLTAAAKNGPQVKEES